jgi:3-dehydroquinate synthase
MADSFSKIQKLQVSLADKQYPILIGEHLIAKPELLTPFIRSQHVMIISNETIAQYHLKSLLQSLQAYQCEVLLLPDGEQYKTLATWQSILENLQQKQFHRDATLIALGGGVIGDMTGFAAACYQRGIDFIQIPTTLLAQVDSSIGGKTAVNLPQAKNFVGAFYQPRAVIIDTCSLKTLPKREFQAGLAEIIKAALIADETFFAWLEANMNALLQLDSTALSHAIYHSCAIKAKIVEQDEKENNIRAFLNFGHTFGHAIEAATHYQQFLHGEAIAIGMQLALQASQHYLALDTSSVKRANALLQQAMLPVQLPSDINRQQLFTLMRMDKKATAQYCRLILLQAIGQPVLYDVVDENAFQQQISHF